MGSTECKHHLFTQHCFLFPVPPNFLISRQHLQEPQSSCVHPVHCPHLLRFLPTVKICHVHLVHTYMCVGEQYVLTNVSLEFFGCASEWLRLEYKNWFGYKTWLGYMTWLVCMTWFGCVIWLGFMTWLCCMIWLGCTVWLLYCSQQFLCCLNVKISVNSTQQSYMHVHSYLS